MQPFIGQTMIFAGNFAPRGWALCEGQLLPISQYSALFSILGTMYGGDGRTTFALPDLRGRVPMGTGQGPGLTSNRQGQKFGSEYETLNITQIPSHNHTAILNDTSITGTLLASSAQSDEGGAEENALGSDDEEIYVEAPLDTELAPGTVTGNVNSNQVTVAHSGGSQAHNNIQPSLVMNYIIALEGIYPSRS